MHPSRVWIPIVFLTFPLPVCGAMNPAAPEQVQAAHILAATGIKGGFIAHVGCRDGRLTAALRASESFVVHGLDADLGNVGDARRHIETLGLYGQVSVEPLQGRRLPYIDDFVNLVVSEDLNGIAMEEVMRVLVPDGVAYIKARNAWTKTVKPRPPGLDEWTHYLHEADNNAVAHDTLVGPPRHFQWLGGPKWSRHHDHMSSVSAVVSAKGRIFYIMDEGPTAAIMLPPKWFLVARDAFNGTILWKRPIAEWNTHLWPLKSGPNQLPRRLVAVGDRVYVTLAIDAPVTVLDAATGMTLRTLGETEHTDEILHAENTLFLLVAQSPNKWKDYRPKFTYVWDNTQRANKEWAWDQEKRWVMALEAESGRKLWKSEQRVSPLTLAVDRERVYFHDGGEVVSLDRGSGEVRWTSAPIVRKQAFPTGYGPTLVVHRDVVLVSVESSSMTALDAVTGRKLWAAPHHRGGHASPDDLLVINGVVWSGAIAGGGDSGVFTGRDLRTGEVTNEFACDVKTYWFHHRCYRAKATDRYVLTSRTGIEFVDLKQQHWDINHWVRGACLYGVMPANGLTYAPPHPCGCYIESKLFGFNALAPDSPSRRLPQKISDEDRLERGPAYEEDIGPSAVSSRRSEDWPTYRRDPARSGSTTTTVPIDLKRTWQTDLGSRLSSVVVAGGSLFVATVDKHTVHALDALTGQSQWSFTAGARIDSPPTIHEGRVLLGAADGWVYCLRANNGQLIWRFRAAPDERRMMAFGQLESPWPVSGSVMIHNGVVYCVAGRSMFLDGGLRLLQLDPSTGRKLAETVLDDCDPDTGENLQKHIRGLDMPVALPDVLSCDGRFLYMRSQRFDLAGQRQDIAPMDVNAQTGEGVHLFARTGFLNDSWWHRSYWMYGRSVQSGWGGWFRPGRLVPYGRVLVCDESTVFGYARKPEYLANASVYDYYLYAAAKDVDEEGMQRVRQAVGEMDAASTKRNASATDWVLRQKFSLSELSAARFKWAVGTLPIHVRAMMLANQRLYVAGPPDVADEEQAFLRPDDPLVKARLEEQVAALEGKAGAQLLVFSATDGKRLAAYELESLPTFDGLAAASGRLYLSTTGGKVLCLGSEGEPLKPAPATTTKFLDARAQVTSLKPRLEPAGTDFAELLEAEVFKSELGCLVRSTKRQASFALRKLDTPFEQRATFKVRMRLTAGAGLARALKNGFFVFGDGPHDDKLVKCGLRFNLKTAVIIEGRINGGRTASESVTLDFDRAYDLTVDVDLASRRVTLRAAGQTVSTTLERRLPDIGYVGYCTLSAATEFGPVELTGQ